MCSSRRSQSAIRWYASVLKEGDPQNKVPVATAPPSHRRSNDTSMDSAIAKAIVQHKVSDFALLSDEERHMLMWNLKVCLDCRER
jgi:hypothetical protein